jgi:UDP-3-O-[3-hydroxymyristoyl] glucosamine N-acyltransferase
MSEPTFFPQGVALSLGEVAALAGAALPEGADPDRVVSRVAPLEAAGPDDLAYMDNPRYGDALATTRAGICLVSRRFAGRVPKSTVALVTGQPYQVYADILARLFPSAMRPASTFAATGISPGSFVHPTARLEHGVIVDPGAVIGPGAEIGSGTVIGSQTVIGPQTRIGRDCSIGSNVSVVNALLGNRVILHPGVRIGQDGFGYAMGPHGHRKVPQVGRVIIQDDVEIGANTTVDRGASRDTIVGEGTKIDNLVQIAHNVVIGRHCVIVGLAGIAGSATLGDYVVVAGQAGIVGHHKIGDGAQIGGGAGVKMDVPAGEKVIGYPAVPVREWLRQNRAIRALVGDRKGSERPE